MERGISGRSPRSCFAASSNQPSVLAVGSAERPIIASADITAGWYSKWSFFPVTVAPAPRGSM